MFHGPYKADYQILHFGLKGYAYKSSMHSSVYTHSPNQDELVMDTFVKLLQKSFKHQY